mmetsp:Transcript_17030/g.27068  ORF Transcript_17030/g.27068 Transcript_17030/m.27068 type:complete len:262 (-) Transcript_17030:230-1015(-)
MPLVLAPLTSVPRLVGLIRQRSRSVPHVVDPLALVQISIGVEELSLATHLIVYPLAYESVSVLEAELSLSMLDPFLKLSNIFFSSFVNHLSFPFGEIIHPVSLVRSSAGIVENPISVLSVSLKLTLKNVLIRVFVHSLSFHLAIHPFPFVETSVSMRVFPFPMHLVVLPVALIDLRSPNASCERHRTKSMSQAILPMSVAVSIIVDTLPIHLAVQELSFKTLSVRVCQSTATDLSVLLPCGCENDRISLLVRVMHLPWTFP